MNPIYKYLVLLVVSMAVIGVTVYYQLGGFKEVEVFELKGEQKVVVGRAYEGSGTHPDVRRYLIESQRLVLDSAINGTLARIVHRTSDESNMVSYFIGILIDGEMAEVPQGYEVRTYQPQRRFAVFLAMNKWVRPSSRKIDQMLNEQATAAGYDLPSTIAELYYVDDSMSVEGWVE